MVNSKTLSILVLFSFIFLNLSILLYLQIDPLKYHSDVDSSAYLGKAELLYKSGTYAPTPAFENMPYFVLGYPTFMAMVYKITSDSINFLIWAQMLLVLLAAFLIFLTARRLFNESVGIIAFALTCLNLGFLVFAQFILTETLLSFLFIAFIERFSLYLTEKKSSALYLSGLILGLSVCVKPAALYYPLLLIPLLYFLNKNNPQKSKFLTTFSIMFLIPIFFYMAHNKAAFDEFKISKLESQNIYFWFYPNVLAFVHGATSDQERAKLQLIAGSDYERIDVVKKMFWDDFKLYPFILYPYIWGKNVIKTFLGLYTSNLKVLVEPNVHGGDISFFKTQGTLIQKAWTYIQAGATFQWVKIVGLLEAIWSLLRYFLCLIALMWLFYKKRFDLLGLFLSFIFYFSIITGHDGCARFRMMFEFILIILAALGLWLIIKRGKHGIFEQEINYENQH
ncbi:MAG: Oligosaccharyl transferase STT3 subunit [candidate division TM6 bacterium GW2011_GWF2_36_6]|nr:MAG: Oligosaccharyl transferase STT3 subunit [candidate division TM6 bacterium GW2011_GWF2_36_6]